MRKFISFIIFITFFVILSSHNALMAFGTYENVMENMGENISICDYNQNNTDIEKNINTNNDDCVSICCYDKDSSHLSFSNLNINDVKKKLEKIKFNFLNLNILNYDISTSNLIGNISPPIEGKYIKTCTYISLIGIIKSNT